MGLGKDVRDFLRSLVHEHGRGDAARAALERLNADEQAEAQPPAATPPASSVAPSATIPEAPEEGK